MKNYKNYSKHKYCKCGKAITNPSKTCIACSKLKDLLCSNKVWLKKEYVLKNKSMSRIAKELKCSISTIRRRLKKFRLKIKTKSQSHLNIKRKPFSFKTRLKMRKGKLGKKLSFKTREKMKSSYSKAKHSSFNQNTIIKHHVNLNKQNNRKNNKLVLTASIHSSLHNKAYKYLVKLGLIRKYIKWFIAYELNNNQRNLIKKLNNKFED